MAWKSRDVASLPSLSRVREAFNYDPRTGMLIWRIMVSRRCPVGSLAGSAVPKSKYKMVTLDGKRIWFHRIIWFLVKGYWPLRIDHRDLDETNNRWHNLREATRSQNAANKKRPASNTSGIKGVAPRGKRWVARIKKDGIPYHIGTFDTADEAAAAYLAKAVELFGEFARAA